jgi:hypothetical protein
MQMGDLLFMLAIVLWAMLARETFNYGDEDDE